MIRFEFTRPICGVWGCLLVAMIASTGCQSLPTAGALTPRWFSREKKPKVVESKFDRPVRMVVLWSPATLNQPGMPPARGFGGRIYFYNEKSETIPVEGQLVVFGYDENTSRDGKSQADRKFVFPAEKIKEHYSPTDMGASYSVWVPWGQTTDPATEITLVSVLTTSSGAVVMDEGAKNNLPGAMTKSQKEIAKSANPNTLFADRDLPDEPDDATVPAKSRMQTATIPLTRGQAERYASRESNDTVVAASAQMPVESQPTNIAPAKSEASNESSSKRERRRRSRGAQGTLLGPSEFE